MPNTPPENASKKRAQDPLSTVPSSHEEKKVRREPECFEKKFSGISINEMPISDIIELLATDDEFTKRDDCIAEQANFDWSSAALSNRDKSDLINCLTHLLTCQDRKRFISTEVKANCFRWLAQLRGASLIDTRNLGDAFRDLITPLRSSARAALPSFSQYPPLTQPSHNQIIPTDDTEMEASTRDTSISELIEALFDSNSETYETAKSLIEMCKQQEQTAKVNLLQALIQRLSALGKDSADRSDSDDMSDAATAEETSDSESGSEHSSVDFEDPEENEDIREAIAEIFVDIIESDPETTISWIQEFIEYTEHEHLEVRRCATQALALLSKTGKRIPAKLIDQSLTNKLLLCLACEDEDVRLRIDTCKIIANLASNKSIPEELVDAELFEALVKCLISLEEQDEFDGLYPSKAIIMLVLNYEFQEGELYTYNSLFVELLNRFQKDYIEEEDKLLHNLNIAIEKIFCHVTKPEGEPSALGILINSLLTRITDSNSSYLIADYSQAIVNLCYENKIAPQAMADTLAHHLRVERTSSNNRRYVCECIIQSLENDDMPEDHANELTRKLLPFIEDSDTQVRTKIEDKFKALAQDEESIRKFELASAENIMCFIKSHKGKVIKEIGADTYKVMQNLLGACNAPALLARLQSEHLTSADDTVKSLTCYAMASLASKSDDSNAAITKEIVTLELLDELMLYAGHNSNDMFAFFASAINALINTLIISGTQEADLLFSHYTQQLARPNVKSRFYPHVLSTLYRFGKLELSRCISDLVASLESRLPITKVYAFQTLIRLFQTKPTTKEDAATVAHRLVLGLEDDTVYNLSSQQTVKDCVLLQLFNMAKNKQSTEKVVTEELVRALLPHMAFKEGKKHAGADNSWPGFYRSSPSPSPQLHARFVIAKFSPSIPETLIPVVIIHSIKQLAGAEYPISLDCEKHANHTINILLKRIEPPQKTELISFLLKELDNCHEVESKLIISTLARLASDIPIEQVNAKLVSKFEKLLNNKPTMALALEAFFILATNNNLPKEAFSKSNHPFIRNLHTCCSNAAKENSDAMKLDPSSRTPLGLRITCNKP